MFYWLEIVVGYGAIYMCDSDYVHVCAYVYMCAYVCICVCVSVCVYFIHRTDVVE